MRGFRKKDMLCLCFAMTLLFQNSCGNTEKASSASNSTVSEETLTVTAITTEKATEPPDTSSPVIELLSDNVVYYQGDDYQPLSYVKSVKDDSGETLTVQYDDKNVDFATPGSYTITYTAEDSAGNKAEKKLAINVKKEYSRAEIKEIINNLINTDFYSLDCEDLLDYYKNNGDQIGSLHDAIHVYGNFSDNISDAPDSIWASDTNVYTTVQLGMYITEKSIGVKNANVDTLNSELVIHVIYISGETKVGNAESLDVVSDKGRISLTNIYEGSTYTYNKKGSYKVSQTNFCFESEKQIEDFMEIIKSNNVSIKVHKDNKTKTFTLNQTQCNNWIKMVQFYENLNEYIRNIPAK